MNENNKIGFMEALCAVLIVILSHTIVILPKLIIQEQGSASIINIIYVTMLALISIFFFNLLYKNFKEMDIIDISEYILGKPFRLIIGLILIVYIIFISSLLIRNTAENLRTMYFQSTPTPYILFFLLVASGIVNNLGLKTVIRSNVIVVILIGIALISLFVLSINEFKYERIFPLLGYGAKNTFLTGSENISIFGNLILLQLIMPLLKNTKQFNKLSYSSVIISGIIITLTITALLLMFPISISSGSNIPLYLQTRSITLGRLIQRVDAFFIIIWIFSILSYICIAISFITLIFKKIANINNSKKISYTFLAILYGTCLIYKNLIQIRKLDTQSYKLLPLIIALGLNYTILIIANIKKYIQNRKSFGEPANE